MLKLSDITNITIHSEEWHQARLGKFTSSEIHHLMSDKWPTQGGLSYVYRKVGEELSGLPCRDEIDNAATRHGLINESECLKVFGERNGIDLLVTQKLIHSPNTRFSSTPDALIVETPLDGGYRVKTVEAKCPHTFDGYISLFMCNTPEDVKREKKEYYWQVIDQMDNCGSTRGYLVVYQPSFKAGQMKVIEFRRVEMMEVFAFLQKRKKESERLFVEVRNKLLSC